MRRLFLTAIAISTLPLAGCCSLTRLFCGPDRSPWVSVDYQTPGLAVHTFLEALRRDDPEIVYLSMSEGFRTRLGVDSSTTQMAWPKIRGQNPGLHLAGYASVPEPIIHGPDTASVILNVEGNQVEIQLVRQCYWEVRYRRPGNEIPIAQQRARAGGHVANAEQLLTSTRISEDPPQSRVTVQPLSVLHYGLDDIPIANINFAGVVQKWRIESLAMLPE